MPPGFLPPRSSRSCRLAPIDQLRDAAAEGRALRAQDSPEITEDAGVDDSLSFEEMDEISDEDLLGEATLAKIRQEAEAERVRRQRDEEE